MSETRQGGSGAHDAELFLREASLFYSVRYSFPRHAHVSLTAQNDGPWLPPATKDSQRLSGWPAEPPGTGGRETGSHEGPSVF